MIAVDWGTSSFRAYRLDAAGTVLEKRAEPAGLLASAGRFEAVLEEQLSGWDDAVIVMAGMIGSRSGWHEVPYVECPAGIDRIAAGLLSVEVASFADRRIYIAPGVSYRPAGRPPEVMRGEETQLLGMIDRLPADGPHTLCLPGTHSKWVEVEAGCILTIRTAMTGELYALLRKKSLLAALMPESDDDDPDDPDAFARGVGDSALPGGLANHLFGVRTSGLFGALSSQQAPSYLSGLLIGHELRGLLAPDCGVVHLIGAEALTERYRRALASLGVRAEEHGEALAARGAFRLALARAAAG